METPFTNVHAGETFYRCVRQVVWNTHWFPYDAEMEYVLLVLSASQIACTLTYLLKLNYRIIIYMAFHIFYQILVYLTFIFKQFFPHEKDLWYTALVVFPKI